MMVGELPERDTYKKEEKMQRRSNARKEVRIVAQLDRTSRRKKGKPSFLRG